MAKILCIETSTKVCSVALGVDGVLVASKEVHEENYSHAENLNYFIRDVMEEAKLSFEDLDAVAVSEGPGSYTGLRIGVSTAKGIAYGANLTMLAVSTLEAMAMGARQHFSGDCYIPMIDARRMEVFCAIYDNNGKQLRETHAHVLEANSFSDLLENGTCLFFGDGSLKFKELLNSPKALFVDQLPSAKSMIPLAEDAYQKNNIVDTAYFEPYYLKDFVAGVPKKTSI